MVSSGKLTSRTAHIPDSGVPEDWWVPGWQVEDLTKDYQWMERQKNKLVQVMYDS
jgi:hypothetical protein